MAETDPSPRITCVELVILVTGDRHWPDNYREPILDALSSYIPACPYVRVVHGGDQGVDSIAGWIAKEVLGYQVTKYPADWDRYHKGAGPIRNQEMLDKEPGIAICLAFHPNLLFSRGTADMVRRAVKKNIPVRVING